MPHNPENDPDMVTCPNCGEDRWATPPPCEHCGHEWEEDS